MRAMNSSWPTGSERSRRSLPRRRRPEVRQAADEDHDVGAPGSLHGAVGEHLELRRRGRDERARADPGAVARLLPDQHGLAVAAREEDVGPTGPARAVIPCSGGDLRERLHAGGVAAGGEGAHRVVADHGDRAELRRIERQQAALVLEQDDRLLGGAARGRPVLRRVDRARAAAVDRRPAARGRGARAGPCRRAWRPDIRRGAGPRGRGGRGSSRRTARACPSRGRGR